MSQEIDKKVLALLEKVKSKKAEIKAAERPQWVTHCSFAFSEELKDRFNLQVVNDQSKLISFLAFLLEKEYFYNEAVAKLNVTTPEFQWLGYSVESWTKDVQTRISQIQLSSKKKDLDLLEKKLDTLVSSEQRRALELAEIEKALA